MGMGMDMGMGMGMGMERRARVGGEPRKVRGRFNGRERENARGGGGWGAQGGE